MGLSVVGQWGRMHVVQCQYVSNTQRLADSWTGLMIRGQHLLTTEQLIDPWICSMIAFSALIYLICVKILLAWLKVMDLYDRNTQLVQIRTLYFL